jgi:hypothetical protein
VFTGPTPTDFSANAAVFSGTGTKGKNLRRSVAQRGFVADKTLANNKAGDKRLAL